MITTTYINIDPQPYLETNQEKERRFLTKVLEYINRMTIKYGKYPTNIIVDISSYHIITDQPMFNHHYSNVMRDDIKGTLMGVNLSVDKNVNLIIQTEPYLHFILCGDGYEESFYINVDIHENREREIDKLIK